MEKTNSDINSKGFATRAIHVGQEPDVGSGAIMTPVCLSSTFVQESPGVDLGYDYSRAGNPTRAALEANLASLEGGAYGFCFGSGCAAADAVMHLLESGDHVLCCDDLYGGTYRLFEQIFRPLGLQFSFVDMNDKEKFEAAFTPNTKLVWMESPTNPLLKIIDIEQTAEAARRYDALLVVDNTFASPYLQTPLSLGADIVLHSSTKYLGGHSDVIGGALVVNDKDLAERIHFVQKSVGGVPSPFDCYLLLRSTKTLALRMEKHCDNAAQLAEFLQGCEGGGVEKVIYPGLPEHAGYEVCKKQMRAPGGMISMVLDGGMPGARKFLERVSVFSLAESLGGVESLVGHPATMTHASIAKEVREAIGVVDGLVRLSVGVEDVADLREDLEAALAAI